MTRDAFVVAFALVTRDAFVVAFVVAFAFVSWDAFVVTFVALGCVRVLEVAVVEVR